MRTPKPFFRKSRQRWYLQLGTKQIDLGPSEREAMAKYFAIMAETTGKAPVVTAEATVEELTQAFLVWVRRNRESGTARWYSDFLTGFSEVWGSLKVADLRPHHVDSWLATKEWNQNTKNGAARSLKRLTNWAFSSGFIPADPLKQLKATTPTPREVYHTREELDLFAAAIKLPGLLDLFNLLRYTGCRPEEAREITADKVAADLSHVTIDTADAKGKRERRVILIPECCRSLIARAPFVDGKGRPWTAKSLAKAFEAVSRVCRVKVTPYGLRHTYVTDAIAATGNPVAVARLVGHKDLTMVNRVYAHLEKKNGYLGEISNHVANQIRPSTCLPAEASGRQAI